MGSFQVPIDIKMYNLQYIRLDDTLDSVFLISTSCSFSTYVVYIYIYLDRLHNFNSLMRKIIG